MEPEKKHLTDLANINIDPISFFDKDEGFVLAYKKTEKLASAMYMVTNLFSDNESIKWTFRKKTTELLSFILTYKDTSELSQNDFVYTARTKVLELVSFLEIAFRAGLLSQMNFSILKQEFSNLVNIFSNQGIVSKNPFHENISKTFFGISQSDQSVRETNSDKIYATHGPDYTIQKMSLSDVKDKSFDANKNNLKRSNRQNIILGLLKKKKDLNIKDMALIIKDCSEKTIQRELNSFISLGIIKRAGVRRWSKYS